MKSRFQLVMLFVVLVVIAVACASPTAAPLPPPTAASSQAAQATTAPAPPTAVSSPLPPPTAAPAQPFVFVDSNEPNTLYPPAGTGPFGSVQYALFDPLVDFNSKLEPLPGLATSWEVASDKITWTFKLRSGVKFHDGTDFTADAVKVTIERILDPKTNATRRPNYTIIKSVDAVDPLTVKFTTTEPFADLPFLLMDRSAFIVGNTAMNKLGVAEFGLHPVGTGAFKFVDWVPNDHITLEANPDYWRGKPKISRIIYRIVPEASARLAALRAGEADIIMSVSPNDLDALRKDANVTVTQQDSLSQVTSEMRQTKPPFTDKRVRQAMNYAIDKDSIVKDIMRGAGRVADSPGPPGVWGSINLTPYPYDPAKAKQLLAEAGLANGFQANLFYVPGRWAGDQQVTEAMQAYWQAVGVKINLQKVDNAGLVEMLARDPDTMAGWTTQQIRTSTYMDYHLYRLFNTEAARIQSAQRSGYSNLQVDQLLAKGRASFDQNERQQYYKDAQKLIWDDAAFVWVFVQQNLVASRKNVTGYEVLPVGDVRLTNVTK